MSKNNEKFPTSKTLKRSLSASDMEDLLFLNNWIVGIIPEISNESTCFYVWLTKSENFSKFLREFKITLNVPKVDSAQKKGAQHHN
jgi:hypothetical protein